MLHVYLKLLLHKPEHQSLKSECRLYKLLRFQLLNKHAMDVHCKQTASHLHAEINVSELYQSIIWVNFS